MANEAIKRTTLRLPDATHQALRMVCAITRETQSAVISRLVRAELQRLEAQRTRAHD